MNFLDKKNNSNLLTSKIVLFSSLLLIFGFFTLTTWFSIENHMVVNPLCIELCTTGSIEANDEAIPQAALRVNPYSIGSHLFRSQRQWRQWRIQDLFNLVFIGALLFEYCQKWQIIYNISKVVHSFRIKKLIRSSFPYRAGPIC